MICSEGGLRAAFLFAEKQLRCVFWPRNTVCSRVRRRWPASLPGFF